MKALALLLGGLLLSAVSPAQCSDLQKGQDYYANSDYVSAFSEFSRLSAQGNADAKAYVGYMLITGRGAPSDYSQGMALLQNMADQKDAQALYLLGLAYCTGQGAPQDPVAAYALHSLAMAPSNSHLKVAQIAADARKELVGRMTAAQIEAGQTLMREIQRVGAIDALDSGAPALAADPRRRQVPPFQVAVGHEGIWFYGRLLDEQELKYRLAMAREQFPRPIMEVLIRGYASDQIARQTLATVLADAKQYGFINVAVTKE